MLIRIQILILMLMLFLFFPKYALAYKGSDIYMKETRGWRVGLRSLPRRPPIVFYRHFRSSTFATLV